MNGRFWLRTLAVALTLSLMWGVSQFQRAEDLKIISENNYSHSFANFVSQVDGLETNLAKSRAAGTPTQQVFYLSQSWQQSETAVNNLSLLPAKEFGLNYVDQILNQIGEYTRILTQQVAKGEVLNSNNQKTLGEMHERLIGVNRNIQELNVTLMTENVAWVEKTTPGIWGRITQVSPASAQGEEGETAKIGSVSSGLEQLDASLQKLPPFSYSGQIDTHSVPEPLGLPDKNIDEEQARTVATDFLTHIGYTSPTVELVRTSNGPLGGYIWKYNSATLDISKKGGVVTLFIDERPLEESRLTIEQAVDKAMNTLKDIGWHVVQTSIEDFGGYITLEAVNIEKGIHIYPDKLRLTVALDNGRITGYDSTAFWLFNHKRNLDIDIMDIAKANKSLNPNMKVLSSKPVIISRPGWEEAFCYEFRGSMNGEEFLVYINATEGSEEKIQRIIKTPRGEYLQ
ncbi:MAG: peptidase M4 [Gracilibacter sp. BRH_c7a]|nr:MAG: peptidase M4 [Gracilibacter sp. BRH_c7a]